MAVLVRFPMPMTIDRRERPTYAVTEAALYLGVPKSTLRSWVYGRYYQTKHGPKFFRPIIEPADPTKCLLSFYNLVEAHVLSSTRIDYRIQLKHIRSAVDYLREVYPTHSAPANILGFLYLRQAPICQTP